MNALLDAIKHPKQQSALKKYFTEKNAFDYDTAVEVNDEFIQELQNKYHVKITADELYNFTKVIKNVPGTKSWYFDKELYQNYTSMQRQIIFLYGIPFTAITAIIAYILYLKAFPTI